MEAVDDEAMLMVLAESVRLAADIEGMKGKAAAVPGCICRGVEFLL